MFCFLVGSILLECLLLNVGQVDVNLGFVIDSNILGCRFVGVGSRRTKLKQGFKFSGRGGDCIFAVQED